jgi:Carboxypeptidase regulatory-like domain
MIALVGSVSLLWRRFMVGLFVAGISMTAADDLRAQDLYGGIVGIVKDAQGGVLPSATVVVVNRDTGLKRETVTNADGAYTFTNVQSGPYDVRTTVSGFREALRSNVPVTVGQISRVDVTLEIGGLKEVVEVTSPVQLLQTDKADVRSEIKSAEITNLPLNQYRNYQALINLVPGSLPGGMPNSETLLPQRSINFTVNGQGAGANMTRTDGTNLQNAFLPNHQMYIPPAETIDSVSIVAGSMDAEQGGTSGAAITVTTKSGTNTLKGSAFEFFNNEKLNADPYYFGRGVVPAKLPFERHTVGGTLGGPIVRNHLFFFGAYEGYISRREQYFFRDVPDARLRNGDFSQALNADGALQRIYDPMSAVLTAPTAGRTQFPNNVIPADRISGIARKVLAYYPMPNVEGSGAGGLTGNYQEALRSTTGRHNFDAKFNWNRTAAHQIWTKVSYMDSVVDDQHVFGVPNTDGDGGIVKTWQYTLGQTWTLGPKLTMDSTLGVATMYTTAKTADYFQGMLGLEHFGIPGTNDQGTGDERYSGLPNFATGFQAIGNAVGFIPNTRDDRTVSGGVNVTRFAGQHEFKAGYTLNNMWLEHWNPEGANPRGSFNFAGNATRTFGTGSQTANFYNTYAAFLLGLVGTAGKSVQYRLFTVNEWQHAAYFRDRWTVSPKLTLDLGLRWEYYPVMGRTDLGKGIELVDLATLDVVLGGVGGNPKSVGLEGAKDNFAPRVGAVYRLDDQTVIRTGYGLNYDARPWAEGFNGRAQYPLAINTSFQTPAAQSQFGWYGTLEQGIPQITGPDLSSGRVPLPNTVTMTTLGDDADIRPRTHSWNLAFERTLPFASVNVAYVGNRSVDAYQNVNANPVRTLGGGATDRPYFASHGRQLAVTVRRSNGKRNYDSLQVAVNRPMSKGLLLKGQYTFSRAWSTGTSYELDTPDFQARNWARQGGNRDHIMQLSFVYQLPWTSDGSSGWFRPIINDWQLNGVFGAFTGVPFTVTADATLLNTPGNTMTADLVGTLNKIGKIGADGYYFDPAAFAQPTCAGCLGNTVLNQFIGPGGWNLDFSLIRSFPTGGSRRIETRIEATNVTDTPKFANPNGSMTSGDFMRIFALDGIYSERQVRLAVRYSF